MPTLDKTIIIDFDSTFTKVEGLDLLAEIALEHHPEKDQIVEKIKLLTNQGMEGTISFEEALQQRIALLTAHKKHIQLLVEKLKIAVSASFLRNKDFFQQYAASIFIISSGFKDFIEPVVTEFGILPNNIYANTFLYDQAGNIVGYDQENPLAKNKGKVLQLKNLHLTGDVYVIGDGYTDYEIKEAGLANKFFAFTENINRAAVAQKADFVTASFEEFLYINQFPMHISYPKSKIKVLLLENIHTQATEIFKAEGYQVEIVKGALNEEELIEKIKDVAILGIRSKTEITKKVLDQAQKLIAIGAFCIGTNQIDLIECNQKGIAVFNAPYSNTRSVVELAIGEMIMLMRNIFDKSVKMHQGIWDKSANNSFEIRGKKLGIVGYGSIGTQLSVLAEALGMEVYFYDVIDKLALGNAKKCKTLHELLGICDVITLHVDGRSDNKNLLGEKEFEQIKQKTILLNLSRGSVVDIEVLVKNIKNGKIIGTAIDVFPYEPKTNEEEFVNELRNLPNVILTPHVGGSTEEAQANIGNYVPNKIIDYINTGSTFMSVNMPNLQLPEQKKAHRLLHIHHNVPGILAQINNIFAKNHINIVAQYLKTNEQIGYVITDIESAYEEILIKDLKSIANTLKFRVLY